jgi:hypothetical protein
VAAVVTASVAGLSAVMPVAPAGAVGPVARVRPVSTAADGEPGDDQRGIDGTYIVSRNNDRKVSRDGHHVVFTSSAGTLAPTYQPCPGGGCSDVFLKDVWTGRVEQISVGIGGAAPDGASGDPAITPDGRYVVFPPWATNLAPCDGGGTGMIGTRVFEPAGAPAGGTAAGRASC